MTPDVRQPHVSMARPAAVVLDSAAGRSTQSTRATDMKSCIGIAALVATIYSQLVKRLTVARIMDNLGGKSSD